MTIEIRMPRPVNIRHSSFVTRHSSLLRSFKLAVSLVKILLGLLEFEKVSAEDEIGLFSRRINLHMGRVGLFANLSQHNLARVPVFEELDLAGQENRRLTHRYNLASID